MRPGVMLVPLPEKLREAGYNVTPSDPPETMRVIAGTIIEMLTLTAEAPLSR